MMHQKPAMTAGDDTLPRVQTGRTDISGLDIFYRRAGEGGEAVILIHGAGSAHSGFTWKHTLPALGARFRAVAPDLPGYGLSAGPDWEAPGMGSPLAYHIDFIPRLLDRLGLERAHLVGNSMGGGLSLGVALAYPERVRSLSLIDSYGLGTQMPGGIFTYALSRLPYFNDLLRLVLIRSRFLVKLGLRQLLAHPARISEELVDDAWESVRMKLDHPAWLAFQRHEFTPRGLRTCYLDRLKEIRCPVLIVHGADDRLLPARHSREAHHLLPHSRLELIPGCGHLPSREHPEILNTLLIEFLENTVPEV